MITNDEYNTMSCTAGDYARKIRKTDKHLAKVLFATYNSEFRRLSRRITDFMDCEHAWNNPKWYHHASKRLALEVDMELASKAVDVQKDVVDNCVEALRTVAEMNMKDTQ